MTSTASLLAILGLAVLTFTGGATAGKGSHIIQAFLESMREGNQDNEPLDGREIANLNKGVIRPPVHGVYALPLSENSKTELFRKMAEIYPDMTSALAMRIFNKRHLPLMYDMDFDGFDLSGLQKYIIKKVKRRPENFPSEMYPIQGGKQQLEVDLDNQLMAQERKSGDMENRINKKENFLIDNEDDINQTGKEIETMNSKEEMNAKDAMVPFPSDIIISGADPSIIGNDVVRRTAKAKRGDISGRRRMDIGKRFWAADSLYKLKIPKSKSGRSYRTRTALPRFDPILYFIGLGK